MKNWFAGLLELQNVDMRLRNLKLRQEMLPKELKSLDQEIVEINSKLKEENENIKKTELEIKKIEGNIALVNETIRKIQANSAMVKKNNEYQAMLHEIEQHKSNISDHESKEINLLDVLENQKNEHREQEKQSRSRIKNITENQAELKQLAEDVVSEIVTLNEERVQKTKQVDQELLSHYNRLLKSQGCPLVNVSNGICGNCHLKLTPQTLAETKKGAMAVCDNCQHLLYTNNET